MIDNLTTELREKLTERGIEYEANDNMGACETRWNDFTAFQLTPSANLIMAVTPEQAIAVTLGSDDDYEAKMDTLLCRLTNGKWSKSRAYDLDFMEQCINEEFEMLYAKELADAELGNGTLTAEQVEKAVYDCSTYASYDGCTYYASGIRLQAIADELNARAERTCHDATNSDAWCFVCSECGKSFPRSKLHLAHNHSEINYCPNCGRKVVSA